MITDPKITIRNLEVNFEALGEGDEAEFAKYFEKYINLWDRLKAEKKSRERCLDKERALTDRGRQETEE